MGVKRNSVSPMRVVIGWIRKQSKKVKIFLGITMALFCLVSMIVIGRYGAFLFVASEAIHAFGIMVLVYKLITRRTCSGLSLKSQELTALFLVVRLICSTFVEANIHTVLDLATLLSTCWVIYMIRFRLKSTYIKELDNFPLYYMVVPSIILAGIVNPYSGYSYFNRVGWAFCVYLESVSVLPQLRMIQNAKMIEPFTGHYVFALGIARFLACANWMYEIYMTGGRYFFLVGFGYLWFPFAILAEIIQTFILADFCYYYIKSIIEGQLLVKMPV